MFPTNRPLIVEPRGGRKNESSDGLVEMDSAIDHPSTFIRRESRRTFGSFVAFEPLLLMKKRASQP